MAKVASSVAVEIVSLVPVTPSVISCCVLHEL